MGHFIVAMGWRCPRREDKFIMEKSPCRSLGNLHDDPFNDAGDICHKGSAMAVKITPRYVAAFRQENGYRRCQ
jgi:hypothetical protein